MTLDVRDLFRRYVTEPARRRPVLAIALAALSATIAAQQQAQLGIAPVTLSSTPYVFDTAEQHKIRVSVVLSGLNHPFSLSFLPNGDALITERGGKLRLVRGATTSMATLSTVIILNGSGCVSSTSTPANPRMLSTISTRKTTRAQLRPRPMNT